MVRFKAYLHVLRRPRVLTLFSSSLVGRIAYAFVLLPLFYVAQDSGSVASAGVAVGVYSAGAGLLAPARASLIDHFGSRRVLTILVLSYGGILALLTLEGAIYAPSWGVIVLAGAAGVTAPPLGPTMRVAWSALLEKTDEKRTGLSLDATVEELMYVVGPAAAGLLLGVFTPWQVLLVPTVLALAGGLLFVRSLSSLDTTGPSSDRGTDPGEHRFLLLDLKFAALLIPALVVGGITGLLDIVVPALSNQMGGPAAAGIILAVFSVGSVIGGLIFGVMRLSWSTTRQLFSACSLLVIATSVIAWLSNPFTLGAALAIAGLFLSPVMVAAYIAAPARASARRSNAATTWVNSSYNLGSAGGSAVTGVLIQHVGSTQTVLAVCCVSLCLVAVGTVLLRTGRR